MGKHNAQPDKTDIVHKAVPIVRTRTHVLLVFCKHTLMEIPAGMLAILIFESNRHGWLNLIGIHVPATETAIRTFQSYL
jgi:hypothetical protein